MMRDGFAGHRALVLLVALIGAIILTAYGSDRKGHWILAVLAYLLIGFGGSILLVKRRSWFLSFALLSLLVVGLEVLASGIDSEAPGLRLLASFAAIGITSLLLYAVLRYAVLPGEIRKSDRILSGICGYLLIAFLWSILLSVIEVFHPGSFADPNSEGIQRAEFLYLSLVTLSTLGYGDFVPISIHARMACALEAVSGVLYIAVFVAALVAGPSTKAGKAEQGE